jgi:predicted AlkP superfamily phosphohydrolase/phosphomutase
MGVPDLRGGLGTATFYSTADNLTAQESEQVVQVRPDSNGMIKTHLIGPRNPATRADFTLEISLEVDLSAKKLTVRSAGKPQALEARVGQWSDWLRVRFKTGLLQSVAGMVRFHLVRLEPVLELYASPVNFDPDAPLFPISSPPEYARDLATKTGTFYTTGMVEDHGGLNNGRFDEAAYLDHCAGVMRERQRMMLYELERQTSGLFYCLFDTPDRLPHMFWRFSEPQHPANHGNVPEDMRHVIEQHYRECDAVVGEAMRFADERTLFIALSDHGMSSFQRGVHLNTWLHDNGLLALKDGLHPGPDAGDMLRQVDWGRTKAYALGLGSIYLNLKGRESQGIVEPSEAPVLQAAIARGLSGLQDPQRGATAIRSVVTREQVYHGPFAAESPDLMVNFSPGWRVSWSTALGGVPAGWFEDNVKKWSGDHIIDPMLTPGVLAMNRPFRREGARLEDLAPTILAALVVPKGPAMEGESLLA